MAGDRLGAILRPGYTLSAADVALLVGKLGIPPWQARRGRLDDRDTAVRAAFAALAPMRPRAASERLAADLARYLASTWATDRERGHAGSDPLRIALYSIAMANGGKPIGARQLRNVIQGARTPEGK